MRAVASKRFLLAQVPRSAHRALSATTYAGNRLVAGRSQLNPYTPLELQRKAFSTTGNTTTHASNRSKQETMESVHQEMKGVLQPQKSASPPVAGSGVTAQIFENPKRKAQYNQALWNAAGSFLLVIFAAQSLKSGTQRRKAEQLADGYCTVVEKKRILFQSLLQEDTWKPLAARIAANLNQVNDSTATTAQGIAGLFATRKSPTKTQDNLQQSEERILAMILHEMHVLVQEAALSDTEKDALAVAGLQNKADFLAKSTDDDNTEQLLRDLQVFDKEDGKVVKRRVFSI